PVDRRTPRPAPLGTRAVTPAHQPESLPNFVEATEYPSPDAHARPCDSRARRRSSVVAAERSSSVRFDRRPAPSRGVFARTSHVRSGTYERYRMTSPQDTAAERGAPTGGPGASDSIESGVFETEAVLDNGSFGKRTVRFET